MSVPKKWKLKDGTTTELDTPYNIRARELKNIYNSLSMNYLTQDERLDVLLTLKHTVKEHDCQLTHEIISLIDREADLLMRGIKEENLQGLRKRISSMFLQYIKTPQFNPAAVKVLKVPQDINDKKSESFYCNTCQRYLPSTEFQVSSLNNKVGKCRNCKHVENTAIKRIDFTKFKYMLKRIQQNERLLSPNSRFCFMMTVFNCFIVEILAIIRDTNR
jgi:IQ and ubiquitin-like domain-containing protein